MVGAESLDNLIAEQGVLTELELRPLFLSLMSILKHLNDHKIVHRNLRTSSFIKTGDKLILSNFQNFGVLKDDKVDKSHFWRPDYRPPEVKENDAKYA